MKRNSKKEAVSEFGESELDINQVAKLDSKLGLNDNLEFEKVIQSKSRK